MAATIKYDGIISGAAIAAVIVAGDKVTAIPYSNGQRVLILETA